MLTLDASERRPARRAPWQPRPTARSLTAAPGQAPHRHSRSAGRSPPAPAPHLLPAPGARCRLDPRLPPSSVRGARGVREGVGRRARARRTLTSQLNTLAMFTSVTVIWSRRWPMSSIRVTSAAFAFLRLSSSSRMASSRGYSSITLAPSHRHTWHARRRRPGSGWARGHHLP